MKKDAQTAQISPLVGTERTFFEEQKEELRAGYELRAQGVVDQWEASSRQVAQIRKKRFREVRLITFFGTVVLKCREGIDSRGCWKCPALAYLGIRPHQRYSPDVERRMAVLAAETGSYEKASSVADATAWLSVSDGAVHSTIQRLDTKAGEAHPYEACAGAAGPQDTLIIMADGWNARHRGINWGRSKKNRKLPERIHWHEIRSAVMFRLSALLTVSGRRKAIMDKHIVAVPADTSALDFGACLHKEAVRMGLSKAKAVFFVMDGGVWLWRIYADRFEKCSKAMLDFYHLSQHLHALGAALHGAGEKATAWCGKLLHELKHKSPKSLFKTLDQLLEDPPSDPATQETLRTQNAYFRSHADHMDYAAHAAQGVPIGSGSVESLCSQLQNRLKRTGQFWTKKGFAALLRIIVRHCNGELDSLWLASPA